jgi:hypothetical protein
LRDFIDHSALVADTDQYKADVPVTLMTAHSQRPRVSVVFLVGLEDEAVSAFALVKRFIRH